MNKIIFVVVLMSFLGACGQLFFKKASDTLSFEIWSLIGNKWLIMGLLFYGVATIGYVISLKYGDLSVLYPIISLSYVFVLIFSWKFLGESLNVLKVLGSFGIILSVGLINYG